MVSGFGTIRLIYICCIGDLPAVIAWKLNIGCTFKGVLKNLKRCHILAQAFVYTMFVCIQYKNLFSMFKLFKVEDTFHFDKKLTTQLSILNRITRFVQFSFTGVIFFSYKINVYEFVGNRVLKVHCFENRNSFSITHRIVIKLNNKKNLISSLHKYVDKYGKKRY